MGVWKESILSNVYSGTLGSILNLFHDPGSTLIWVQAGSQVGMRLWAGRQLQECCGTPGSAGASQVHGRMSTQNLGFRKGFKLVWVYTRVVVTRSASVWVFLNKTKNCIKDKQTTL